MYTHTRERKGKRMISDTNQTLGSMNEKKLVMQTVSKQRSEVVRGTEKGLPYCPRSRVTVSNDHFCDYATGLILLAATSQK